MEELHNLLNIANENNLIRTLINCIFSIDSYDTHKLVFTAIKEEILCNNTYNYLKISNISSIAEIKGCFINKHSNQTVAFINFIDKSNLSKKKKKNISINVINNGNKSEDIKLNLLNFKTSFDSFVAKKKIKTKPLIKLIDNTSSYTKLFATRFSKLVHNYHNNYVTTLYSLILEIDNEKIITEGRLLLPNSISITLLSRSKIILYENNKIQFIIAKQKNETYEELTQHLNYIYNTFISIVETYCNSNISINIINMRLYCDFHLRDKDLIYPVHINDKQIRFFGKGKLNLQSIYSSANLIDKLQIIKNLKQEWLILYKAINRCNPLKDNIKDIEHIVNTITGV